MGRRARRRAQRRRGLRGLLTPQVGRRGRGWDRAYRARTRIPGVEQRAGRGAGTRARPLSGALGGIVEQLWLRRTLRFRISSVATAVTLVVLLLLAVQTSRLTGPLLVSSADAQLQSILDTAVSHVREGGSPVDTRAGVRARVLDTSGAPVDGLGPSPLRPGDVNTLKAGTPVLRLDED